jgi:glycosyltransferase involved in cell wall biosynthesis
VRRLLVVAPLGPVVTGRSVVSRHMARAFLDAGIPSTQVNVGPRSRTTLGRALRPAAFCVAIGRLLADRGRTIGGVYLAVDAGAGMGLSIATVAAARVVRAPVVLHHHSYAYVRRPRRRAAWLLRTAGRSAVNIVQCPAMLAGLLEQYGAEEASGLVLSNAVTVPRRPERMPDRDRAGDTPVSIGFLGDVTLEKGLAEAIGAGVSLARRRPGSRVLVAGPCTDRGARSHLREALRRYPGIVQYLGPLDEPGKDRFFASLDVFVFPSRYDHETQGIVNLEALARGVPVVARATGCIAEDLARVPGTLVAEDRDFEAAAADAIVGWAERGELRALQAGARRHFDLLRSEAEDQQRRAIEVVADLVR